VRPQAAVVGWAGLGVAGLGKGVEGFVVAVPILRADVVVCSETLALARVDHPINVPQVGRTLQEMNEAFAAQ